MLFPLTLWADDAPTLDLRQERLDWVSVAPSVTALRDPTHTLKLETALRAEFAPLQDGVADFGYTKDHIWLRFSVRNTGQSDSFVLALRENFFPLYEVWLIDDDGAVTLLEAHDETTLFRDRALQQPEMTTPVSLSPGQEAEIIMRYSSGGSSELSWRIFERQAFIDWSAGRTARNFIYYGMATLLVVGAALSWVVMGRHVFGAYAFYAGSALLFIVHADGNAFRYLWPNLPLFNAFASIPLGTAMIVSGLNFARSYLATPLFHPKLDKVLLSVFGAALLLAVSSVVVDTQMVKQYLVLMAMVATALLAISGFIAARTRFREVRFYVLAWLGAVISSTIMTLRHWFGIDISEDVQFDSMRVVLVMDAILMGLAIVDRFNWLKQSQREALEISLAQAQKTIGLNIRLQDLEQQVVIAERLAQSQQANLSQTVHDLRQPLTALRLNLRSLTSDDNDPGRVADVEETLSYLETLVAGQLSSALVDTAGGDASRAVHPATKATEIGPMLESIADMFAADAAQKGLRIRHVATKETTHVPALALARMVINLVANAIHATDHGGILVGLRRAGGLRIEVHDTGSGLSKTDFERAQTPLPEGATHGLGLRIVRQLAQEHGMRVERVRAVRHGTVIRLWLPAAE